MRFRFGLILFLAVITQDAGSKPLPPFSGQIFLDNVDYSVSHYYFRANLRNVSGADNVATELHLPHGVSLLRGGMQWSGKIPQGSAVDISFVLYVPKGTSLDNVLELVATADNGVHGLLRYNTTNKTVSAYSIKPVNKSETASRFGRALHVVRLK